MKRKTMIVATGILLIGAGAALAGSHLYQRAATSDADQYVHDENDRSTALAAAYPESCLNSTCLRHLDP